MVRRSFNLVVISSFTAWILFCTSGCSSTSKVSEINGLPIVQGLTNAVATQIAVAAPSDLHLDFFYGENALAKIPSNIVSSSARKSTDLVVHHLQIENLKVGTEYTLEVREASGLEVHGVSSRAGRLVDRRRFKSLDTSPRPARVIAASCLYDLYLNESKGMWKALLDAKPDLLLLIGDNVYAEVKNGRFPSPLDESALWTRYSETFQALDFYKSSTLVPTLVTWDDHDYGMKDGSLENPHKLESKKVLEAFFAQAPSPIFSEFTKGPGVSSKFDAFGYRFLLLDNRSFRTPKDTTPEDETHFGIEQEKWIRENVINTSNPVWLISGDQWFGAYHRFESYEGRHPQSFKRFLRSLRDTEATLMFLSGDRHMSEVNRIESTLLGYETFEFTSSALHSKTHASNWDTIPNKRQVRGIDLNHSFTMFNVRPQMLDRTVILQGEVLGRESKVLYSFDFEIKRSRPRKPRR